jgi:transcriptional regulator with XRE-family HTH domain
MKLHPLRLCRLQKGWSQYDLSFRCKVSQGQISYAERGYCVLNDDKKKRIATALSADVDTLFPPDYEK